VPSPRLLLAKAALWLAVSFLLFPGAFIPFATGLDASYLYALNALARQDLVFGRDVVFSFGPLGYLLLPGSPHLLAGAVLRVTVHAVFCAGLLVAFLRVQSCLQAACFSLGLVLAAALGLTYEYQLLLVLALLLGLALESERVPTLSAQLAAALAVVFALIKVSLGAAAVTMVAAYLVTVVARKSRGAALEAATAAGAAVLSGVTVVVLVFHSFASFWRWVEMQAEILRGFGSAMSHRGETSILALGLAGLGGFAVLAALALRERGGGWLFWPMVAPAVLLAFKHGFVRQDGHVVAFFAFLLGVLALGVLFARSPEGVQRGLIASLAAALLAAPVALRFTTQGNDDGVALLTGRTAYHNLAATLHLERTRRALETRSRRLLVPDRLPAAFVAPLRDRGLGVDVVPWELSYLPANDLRWVPNPILQLYHGYTGKLDAWTASHFEGPRAPDVVLAELRGVSERNMVWDTPQTWRALWRWYEPMGIRPRPGLLALRRRATPAEWSFRRLKSERLDVGRWYPVPANTDWLFAELDMPLSFWGRIAQTAFRVPPVYIETAYADGRQVRWRLVPDTAGSGILMSHAPRNLRGLAELWRREPGPRSPRILRFRFVGPGLRYYPEAVGVVWRVGRLETGD
jgi:hypothetical protein